MSDTGAASPFTKTADGIKFALRLTPRAGAEGLTGLERDAQGRVYLKAGVTAPPEGGKANAALIRLLAREWHLAKGAFHIAAGANGRRKVIKVNGEAAALMDRLENWREEFICRMRK